MDLQAESLAYLPGSAAQIDPRGFTGKGTAQTGPLPIRRIDLSPSALTYSCN